jgi:hypothetical protein
MPSVDQGGRRKGEPVDCAPSVRAHASSGPGVGDSSNGSCAPSACIPSAVITSAIGSGASPGVDADGSSIVERRVRPLARIG